MKYTLAENMRRFATKNLREAAQASKSTEKTVPRSIVGRTVTMWANESQTGNEGMDIGVASIRRIGKDRVILVAIDLADEQKVAAYESGRSVTASEEFMFDRGAKKFFGLTYPGAYYNRWLVAELTKIYFS